MIKHYDSARTWEDERRGYGRRPETTRQGRSSRDGKLNRMRWDSMSPDQQAELAHQYAIEAVNKINARSGKPPLLPRRTNTTASKTTAVAKVPTNEQQVRAGTVNKISASIEKQKSDAELAREYGVTIINGINAVFGLPPLPVETKQTD